MNVRRLASPSLLLSALLWLAAPSALAVTPTFVDEPTGETLTAGDQDIQVISTNINVTFEMERAALIGGFCRTGFGSTPPIGTDLIQTNPTTAVFIWGAHGTDATVGETCITFRACPDPFNSGDSCRTATRLFTVNAEGAESVRLPHRYTTIENDLTPTRMRFEPTNANIGPNTATSTLFKILSCPTGATDCASGTTPSWIQFGHDSSELFFDVLPPFGTAGTWIFTADSGNAARFYFLKILPTSFVHIEKRAQSYGILSDPYLELDRHHVEDEDHNDSPSTAPYFDRGYMSGDIDPIGDIDHFAFHTGGEEFHKFRVSARRPTSCNFDGRLSVHELLADGTLGAALVEDDSSGPGACPETPRTRFAAGKTFIVKMHEDGDNAVGHQYFIEHDYWVEDAEESDALDAELLLQPGMFGRVTNGNFSFNDDNDYARFLLRSGEKAILEVNNGAGGCPDDLFLKLFEQSFSTLTLVASNDTGGPGNCPRIEFTRPDDSDPEFVVEVSHQGSVQFGISNSDNYFLDFERVILPDTSDTPSWLDVQGFGNAFSIQPGTCSGAVGLFLDDVANNADYFGIYDADFLDPVCSTNPDAEVRIDGQGVCRERDEPDGASSGWSVTATRYGTRLATTSTGAPPRMMVAHGAGRGTSSEADGTSSGSAGSSLSTDAVIDASLGVTGNDFYYDPWGECDVQTYPNASICKVPLAGLDPASGQSPSCTITSTPFLEGTRAVFEMTRWNQSAGVSISRCSSLSDTTCSLTMPSGVSYNSASDEFIWDIPFNATGSLSTFTFRLRAAASAVAVADYYFVLRVQNATTSSGNDLLLRDLREQKPLAHLSEDLRLTKRSFKGIDSGPDQQSITRHDGNDINFMYATNVALSRSVPPKGRIAMHPAFAHGRIGDPKGDSTFSMTFKANGSSSSAARTANIFLKPAFANESGQLSASNPTGSDTPFATVSVPALAAGATAVRTFSLSPGQALPSAGYEPFVGGIQALFIDLAGSDSVSNNDLAGPFFVGPATRPPTRTGCIAGRFDQPGFAGTFCGANDVTGTMVVTPESPTDGQLVTVNVQASFVGGSSWTSSSVVRFYQNQTSAPSGTTANNGQRSFPNTPSPDLVYGFTFTFDAEKPNNSTNTIPLRAFLDATNAVTEGGDGEANNQLPSVSSPFDLVVANTPPLFRTAANTTATEDSTYSYQVQISDDDAVDFSRLALTVDGPSGMAFTGAIGTCAGLSDRKCRTLQWVPDDDDAVVGSHPVTVFACDGDPVAGGAGDCTEQNFVINVTRVNDPPIILTSSFNTTATEDSAYTQNLSIIDEEGDTVTFSLPTNPAGMTIVKTSATTAQVRWTPDDNGVGSKSVIARVAESANSTNRDEAGWTITVSNVNDAPVLGAPTEISGSDEDGDASALTGAEDQIYAARMTITDVDNTQAGQGQSFTCSKQTPTPAWIAVTRSGNFCTITGTPDNGDTGSQTVNVRVVDNGSPALNDTRSYTLTVADIVNDVPTLAGVAAQVVDQDATLSVDVDVADADLDSPGFSESFTFTQTAGPSGTSLTNNGDSVTFEWTPGPTDVGSTAVTLRVEDVRGGVDTVTFNVTVNNVNDVPVLSQPANATHSEGGSFSATLAATDADTPFGDSIAFSVVSGAPPGFSVNSSTGAMSLNPIDDAQVGVHTITVRATDEDGAFDEATFTLTITNVEEDPVLSAIPGLVVAEDATFSRTAVATDPDPGATITFSLTAPPSGMTINSSTGAISWVPRDADVGARTITVVATDNTGRTDTEAFTLTVTNTNDAPLFTSTAITGGTEESLYSYTATATDDDLDSGDALSFSATLLPSWLSFNTATRVLSGTPDDDDVGSHSVILRVADIAGAAVTQSFTVTVIAVNDAPVLETIGGFAAGGAPIAFAVDEGATLNVSVLGSDVDDIVGLVYDFSVLADSVAVASINATTGAFQFQPTFDEAGVYSVEFSITDPNGAFDTEIVTITVNDVNRRPDFTSTPVTTATEDVAYTYDVNATDDDGDTITFSLATKPTGMTINGTTGVISWTPNNAQVGANSVSVRATDEHGLSRDQNFTVTVTNVNDAPVFTSTPVIAVAEESPYTYTATASDDDGDSLTFSAPTLPGWLSFNASTRVLSGTPDDDDVGANSVTLRVTDGNGGTTNQSFTVTVSAVNDAPVFTSPTPSGTIAAAEGSAVSFTLLATDPDGPSLSYSITGLPTGATINASTGAFAWTPSFNQAGTFNLTLRATDGSLVASRALSITVSNTDRAPVASAPSTATTDEGVNVSFTVSGTDADGDTVALSLESGPSGVSFNTATGAFSWTPSFTDDGDHDVVFRATAGGLFDEVTTTITVDHVNQAPVLGAPSSVGATQDAAFVAILDATDIDLGTAPTAETLTFSKQVGPEALIVSAADADTAQLNWTPTAADVGTHPVTVRVVDAAGAQDDVAFVITVANVNDPPVITSTAITTGTQGVSYGYTLTFSDADAGLGDVVTLSAPTLPSWLSFTASTGVLTGVPNNADALVGSHPVVLRARDTAGLTAQQSFSIIVDNVNDAPTIDPVGNKAVAENATLSFTVTARDVDGIAPALSITGLPPGASFNTSTVGATEVGSFNWTPGNDDAGSFAVSFTANDGSLTDVENITIAVGNVNLPPDLAAIGARSVAENASLAFTVSASDGDGDSITLSAVGGGGAANPFSRGATFNTTSGAFSWSPGFNDAGAYSVTFTANDGNGGVDSELVNITVTNTNRAPVYDVPPTPGASVNGAENSSLTFTVQATDLDGDPVSYSLSPLPSGASFNTSSGVFTWVPGFNQAGTFNVNLTATDGTDPAPRALAIVVANSDRAPTISAPASRTVAEGANVSFAVTGNDADGDSVVLSLVSGPTGATFTGGTFSYTPGFADQGPQSATFRATAGGLTANATTSITVTNVNRAPSLGAPSASTATQDTAFVATLTATDADIGTGVAETLSFTKIAGPSTLTVEKTNATTATVRWTPSALEVNPPTQGVTIRVTDAAGASADSAFDLTVVNVNDAPVLQNPGNATVAEGATFTVTATASDLDIEAGLADTLTFSLTTAPTGMTINGSTGTITWATTDDDPGVAAVTVRVADSAGASDTANFNVTVTNVADAPVFTSTAITAATQDVAYSYTATVDDADLDFGDTLTLSAPTLPAWLSFNTTTGVLSGTPDNNDVGTHAVELRVVDSTGRNALQSFSISVANVNDAPVFVSVGSQAVAEGGSVGFTISVSDPDGDSVDVVFTSDDLPPAATFNGTSFSWSTGFEDAGNYTATFTADDGALSTVLEVAITVGAINRAPILTAIGNRSVNEGVAIAIVADAFDDDADPLTFTAVPVTPGSASDPFIRGASFVTDTFAWTPGFADAGTYSVRFTVNDGATTDSETITITVNEVNRAPVFTATPPSTTAEDALFSFTASASDADSDSLSFSLVTAPAAMSINGSSGVIQWTPVNADVGTEDILVRVSDGRGGTADLAFTLTVTNTNDAPVITSVAVTNVAEGGLYSYTVTASDVDVGDTLTLSAQTIPSWLAFNATTGLLSGTPDDPDVGSHNVVLRASDVAGAIATQSFAVVVSPQNDAPAFVAPTPSGTLTVAEDATLTFTVVAEDPDGPSLTYSAQGLPTGATLDSATGVFSWRPGFNDAGSRALTIIADDSITTATRTLTLQVTNTDRAPTLTVPATANGLEGTELVIVAAADDPDGDTVTVRLVSGPAGSSFDVATRRFRWTPSFDDAGNHQAVFEASAGGLTTQGTVAITIGDTNRVPRITSTAPTTATEDLALTYLVTAVDDDGDPLTFSLVTGTANASLVGAELRWTPTGAQVGNRSFVVRISDGRGGLTNHAFDIVVAAVNDAPVITTTAVTTATEDLQYTYDVNASDEEGEVLTFTLIEAPARMVIDAETGVITWVPANGDVGVHQVAVRVTDPQGGDDEQGFQVSVTNVNDAPVILADPAPPTSVAEGALFTWTPAVSDVDVGDVVTLSLVSGPTGMAFSNGTLSWSPDNDDVGVHPVRVRATDTAGASVIRDFNVEVFNLNDPPFFISAAINATVAEEDILVATVLADDIDAGETLIFTLIGAPSRMTIDAASGQLLFTPDDAEVGTHNFTVRVEDLSGAFVEQSARVVVTAVNDRPTLDPIANQQVDAGNELVVALNAVDPDGPGLTFTLTTALTGATVTGSTFRFTPTPDQTGLHDITVTVSDGSLSDSETFTVVVGQGDLPPGLTIPADATVDEGQQITVLISATNAPGQEDDTITLGVTNLPPNAQFQPGPGAFTWVPSFDDAGVFPITFTATNSAGTTNRVWNLTVRDVNRSPFLTTSLLPPATEGVAYAEVFEANDLDGDVLSFALVRGPTGLSVDAVSGAISYVPAFADVGLRVVRVRVQDGRGGIDERDFDLQVLALDEDNDGLPDTFEVQAGLDPTRNDAGEDPDDDGLTNLEEFQQGKDPFVSNAPTAPGLVSPAAEERVRTARPTLVGTEATDPDGDALTYLVRVALESDPLVDVFFVSELLGVDGEVRTEVGVDLIEGERYLWQVFATDGQGLSPEGETRIFIVDAINEAPPAPTVVAPVDGSSVATPTPILRVTPVVDPDGDVVSYVFTLRQVASGAVEIQSSPIFAEAGSVQFPVGEILPDESVWFWEVTPTDDRGLSGVPSSQARFTVDLQNLPPPTPSIIAPAADSIVNATPVTLVVSQVADPEGLGVTYDFELSTNAAFPVAGTRFFQNSTPVGGEVSVDAGDLDDDVYFWRVTATDGASFSDPVSASFTVDAIDDPPLAPTLLAPANNSLVTGVEVQLSASTVSDPDGDEALRYTFELTDSDGLNVLDSQQDVDDADDDGIVTALFANLVPGDRYGWRVRADEDDGVSSPFSALFTFRVELINQRPGAPVLLAPDDGANVSTATPTLRFAAAIDPDDDAVVHDLEILQGGTLLTRVQDLTSTAGIVTFTPTAALPEGLITWRARGRDSAGGGLFAERTFTVVLPDEPDAGPGDEPDAGPGDEPDAGPGDEPDAGPGGPDAGPGPGVPDAGPGDGPDDRVVVDFDGPAPRLPNGCSCDMNGPGDPVGVAFTGAFAVGLLLWRRRRRS